ncbi:hypothetical protein BT96DRAFT_986561 [Gymnopus androsaceus JB14]|uniref:Uncharacterized protein n=1 Tax=Gymnopus androsaceus JB14 TaxID=1447944 RepID=A0A6A4IAJ8_9AGAR|nr:hypothetical protein BT96DRAFT_986561 [Gymnopus androsaceus JB14]
MLFRKENLSVSGLKSFNPSKPSPPSPHQILQACLQHCLPTTPNAGTYADTVASTPASHASLSATTTPVDEKTVDLEAGIAELGWQQLQMRSP